MKGWETLHTKLGSRCLLIAGKVLCKGLPLKNPSSNVADASPSELTQALAQDAEPSMEVPNQSGELEGDGGRKSEAKADVVTAHKDEEPRLEYLSCAGIQLEATVWSTMQKAAALKGDLYSLILHGIV